MGHTVIGANNTMKIDRFPVFPNIERAESQLESFRIAQLMNYISVSLFLVQLSLKTS